MKGSSKPTAIIVQRLTLGDASLKNYKRVFLIFPITKREYYKREFPIFPTVLGPGEVGDTLPAS